MAWWSSSILKYFLRSEANIAVAKTVSGVWDWLRVASSNDLMDVVIITGNIISGLLQRSDVTAELMDNIFSLSVAERPVKLEQRISPEWTVERAQSRSLLHWKITSGGLGIIVMPPILLHLIHLNSGISAGAQVHPLRRPSATMTSDDNESLAISALLHKLKAASIVGLKEVDFYKDLLGEPGRPVRSVTVPKCFDYEVLSTRVLGKEFKATKLEVLGKSRQNSAMAPIAFINGRSASFEDALIIFPELTIYMQEKKSTKSCQQNAAGRIRKRPLGTDLAIQERNKVDKSMTNADFSFHISDDQSGGTPLLNENIIFMFTIERHHQLFGKTLTWLRSTALEYSDMRSDSNKLKRKKGGILKQLVI